MPLIDNRPYERWDIRKAREKSERDLKMPELATPAKPTHPRANTIENLLQKVSKQDNGCWLWTVSLTDDGYGICSWNGKNARVHRLFFEYFKEPIPRGFFVCHKCDVRNCVNPDRKSVV